MLKYFKGIESVEELKKAYKELAKKFHPDLGGNKEKFQEMNNEYDLLFKSLKANKKDPFCWKLFKEKFYARWIWYKENQTRYRWGIF